MENKPEIEIKLERENGIFYPGEIVRGQVILKVPTNSYCNGGVFLDFSSKATTEWFTGGDAADDDSIPKKHFTGETVFQHQIQTLMGSTYSTGNLRAVGQKDGSNCLGEAVDFSKETGILHIPYEEDMRLRVEAMGSDTIVDVPKLLEETGKRKERPMMFYLTSVVGNMQKGSIQLSATLTDYETAYPESVGHSDQVLLALRIHRLRGLKKGAAGVRVVAHNWTRVSEAAPDKQELSRVEIPAGTQKFLFSIPLREDAAGSACFRFGNDSATVSYRLGAYLDFEKKQHYSGMLLTVIPNRPLPRPALMSPYNMESGDQPISLSRRGNFFQRKKEVYTVSLKLSLSRLVYAPGECIDMIGSTVVNNSSEDQRAQVVMCTFLEQDGGYRQKNSQTRDHVFFETVVPARTTVILNNVPEFKGVRIPALPPSYAGIFLNDSKTERLEACVKWTYTLELRLPDWGNGFYCRSPILLSAASPFTSELQKYRNEKKSEPDLTDYYSIFKQSVSGAHNSCKTAPTVTCPEQDRGHKALAFGAKPVWMGSREDYAVWMRDESNRVRLKEWVAAGMKKDSDYPDLCKLFYRNVVNLYGGPSGSLND